MTFVRRHRETHRPEFRPLSRVTCADGRPGADALQRDYLDAGSSALSEFTRMRIGSMERLAQAIAEKPALYEHARSCAAAMPEIRSRVVEALGKLEAELAMARFPPVTILVDRGNTGGMTTPAGVVIGLEALCNADWMQASVDDRFVHGHPVASARWRASSSPTVTAPTFLAGSATAPVTTIVTATSGFKALRRPHARRWGERAAPG